MFLTKELLVQRVRQPLSNGGTNCSTYSGHSSRIGAATTAAACGIQDSFIKTLGKPSVPAVHQDPTPELSSPLSVTSLVRAHCRLILFYVYPTSGRA